MDATTRYLENEILLSRAVAYMVKRDLLHVQEDDFGPPLYSEADFTNACVGCNSRTACRSLYGRYMSVPARQRH